MSMKDNIGDVRIKTLLVDDDEDDYYLTRAKLGQVEYSKFEVEWTSTFYEALEIIRQDRHDVYIIDYNLGKHSGLELLKLALSDGSNAPFILLTGQGDREIDMEAMRTGVSDYLNKNEITPLLLERSIRYAIANKKAEKKIKQTLIEKEELLNKQTELLDELRKAKDQAEEATKLKNQFLSLVSHDLKIPLTTIIGYIDLIRELLTGEKKGGAFSEKNIISYLDTIRKSAWGLVHLINKLLDISRLQTGKIALERRFFEARELVEENILKISHVADTKKIRCSMDVPQNLRFFGDRDLVGEVILNLLSNAVKFTEINGMISVYMPSKNILAIKDTGKGINEKLLPDLFKHEVKTTTVGTHGEKGTGLGLPHCQDIMRAHGGNIGVETGSGGSVFFMNFPSEKPCVLVVDDQEEQRLIVKVRMLEVADVEIVEADSGIEALEKIKEINPVVIITDIRMPQMDGLEFIHRVRTNQSKNDLPIIVMTSLSTAGPSERDIIDIRSKAMELGANDFITKPLIPEDFIPRIQRYFY